MAVRAGTTGVLGAAAVIDAVARRWARIAAETCYVPISPLAAEARLRHHAARLLAALAAEPFTPGPAREVGEALVEQGFVAPELLGRTLELFDASVLGPLGVPLDSRTPAPARSAAHPGPPAAPHPSDSAASRPAAPTGEPVVPTRDPAAVGSALARLRGALATGYTEALRKRILTEQEEVRAATLAARADLERASQAHEARFRAVFENAAVGIAISDADGVILEANPALRTMLGYSLRQLRKRRLHDLFHAEAPFAGPIDIGRTAPGRGTGPAVTEERPLAPSGGGVLWTQLTTSAITSPTSSGEAAPDAPVPDAPSGAEPRPPQGVQLTIVEDVTDRRRMRTQLVHQALHDPMTGLPNRTLFFDQLRETLSRAAPRERVGVLLVALHGLTAVNDSLGHEAGDRVLSGLADRLADAVSREGHLVARIDGNDFAVLLGPDVRPASAEALARGLVTALGAPFRIDAHAVPVTATVGSVVAEAARTDTSALVRAAQTALSWAKATPGQGWAAYDPERAERENVRRRLAAAMPGALDDREFELEFQPIVALGDGRVRAAEALVRWRHPTFGVLSPDRFIPLAEETGFIVPLGRWILAEACRHASRWARSTGTAPLVSVNVAPRQLTDPGILHDVARVLERTGLSAEALQLEITESAIVGSTGVPSSVLKALADDGVRIAIDDFGTGYSNLAYLQHLPVRELKLAGPFVTGLEQGASADATAPGAGFPGSGADSSASVNVQIVGTLVALAHTLGLGVTAEGVETAGQAARLRELGCDSAQGWHFARSMAPERFAASLDGPTG